MTCRIAVNVNGECVKRRKRKKRSFPSGVPSAGQSFNHAGERRTDAHSLTPRFISDIAAFQLKPLFLIGALATASSFLATLAAVHFSRYDPRIYGIDDSAWKRGVSLLAVGSGVVAGLGLVLLAVLDTLRFHKAHAVLLLVCFVGLVLSMLLTTGVWWDQAWNPSPFRRLRV